MASDKVSINVMTTPFDFMRDQIVKLTLEKIALQRDVDEAIGERDSLRKELQEVTRERDALREEIASRDAEKPTTALSWIEKTDARLEKMERDIEDIINRREKGVAWAEKTLIRLEKIEARQNSYMDLEKRIDSLTASISSRLDGPTGVDKRIVAVEAKIAKSFAGLVDRMNSDDKHYRDRLAKLEARVSKKRVKK